MPEGYRVEISPNNRAVCKNKECKDSATKILKGELRFASLFTVQEHTSWAYKHWGCLTPVQISNVNEFLGGDMDLLDGYDDLPQEYKDKIDFALKNGHVPDEDWKGDVEMNRPGMKGFRVKTPKKKAGKKADQEEEDGSPKPKKKRGRAVKEEVGEEAPPPKKARGKKAAVKKEDDDAEPEPVKPKGRGKKAAVKEEADEEEPEPKPKKARGKKAAVKEEEAEDAEPMSAKSSRRGKKAVVYKESDEEDVDLESDAEAKPKRGKKKAAAAKPAPQKRGRKKAAAGDE